MAATGEVKVMTARQVSHVTLNGEVKTVADAVRAAGENPDNCNIRVDGELLLAGSVNNEARAGMTITAFRTTEVASAGVKGAAKS